MYRTVATLLAMMLVMPIHTKNLPSEFKQCKRNDPEVSRCLGEAIQQAVVAMKDGIPSHHLLSSDPLSISKIAIEEKSKGPVSLDLIISDAKLHGLKDIQISNVKADLDKRDVILEAFLKVVTLDGDYTMNGKFLVLPLQGKGKLAAQLDEVKVKVHIKADSKMKNGDTHWDIKDFILEIYEIKKLTTKFENLFNGDETLGKPTQESLNDNWKALWDSLNPAINQVFAAVLSNAATTILDEVPEKDMFL